MLSFYSVHTPLIGRPDLVAKYKKKAAEINGAEFGDEEMTWPKNGKTRKVRILQKHAVYAAMVEAMDLAVGKVLDKLESLGLDDEVVVAFTSDNGGLSTSEGSPTSNLPLRWERLDLRRRHTRTVHRSLARGHASRIRLQRARDEHRFLSYLRKGGRRKTQGRRSDRRSRPDAFAQGWRKPVKGRPLLALSTLQQPRRLSSGAIRMGTWKMIERYEDGQVHLYDLSKDVASVKISQKSIPGKSPRCAKTPPMVRGRGCEIPPTQGERRKKALAA